MKLSVLIIAYNHEKFIAQAIESALDQDVDLDYEIVIAEDCSTDDTLRIASEYEYRYPDRIRLLPSERNLGAIPNFVRGWRACRGQYIATLDGDDYWTSPHKLSRQVSFMDSHPECAMCFHNVDNVCEDCSPMGRPYITSCPGEILTIDDILPVNIIPTLSAVFRNGLVTEFPDWYFELPFGDWSLFILQAKYGSIGYIDEIMGAYRRHAAGVTGGDAWTGPQRRIFWKGELRMYRHLRYELGEHTSALIRLAVSRRCFLLAEDYEKSGDYAAARRYALRRVAITPFDRQGEGPLKHLIRLCVPRTYGFAKSLWRIVTGQGLDRSHAI